jgi:hypothetical protein
VRRAGVVYPHKSSKKAVFPMSTKYWYATEESWSGNAYAPKNSSYHLLKERADAYCCQWSTQVKTTEAATTSAKRRSILKEQRWLHRYKD